MTVERTEMVGLTAGHLQLTMGGEPVEVRPLTHRESDAWLVRYATAMAGTEVMEGETGEEQMLSLVTQASRAALELVAAYDIEGVLGGSDAIADRASKREIAAALEMMVTVEDPLAPSAGRLAAAVFGLPAQLAAERMESASEPMLRLVRSLSTLSERGDSTTPATSTPSGRRNNSSSTGRTRRTATAGKPTSAAS